MGPALAATPRGLLRPGIRVIDVGSGARPTIPPDERPAGTAYSGLDVSAEELRRAPAGSYDEIVAAPAERIVPELEGRFDLAVSWLAIEHVGSLADVLASIHAYLVPGGTLVAQLAGARSPFSLANGAAAWCDEQADPSQDPGSRSGIGLSRPI